MVKVFGATYGWCGPAMSSWVEQRRERRRRRRRFEEIVGWIVVPPLLILGWWIGAQVYDYVREPAQALINAAKGIKDKNADLN